MKKRIDELRPEYDLSQLKGCVRGKHATMAKQGTNIILLEQERGQICLLTGSHNKDRSSLAGIYEDHYNLLNYTRRYGCSGDRALSTMISVAVFFAMYILMFIRTGLIGD